MAIIWTEDFESATGVTTGGGGAVLRSAPFHSTVNGSDDNDGDYSVRANSAALPTGADAFTGFGGQFFWTAEDTDSLTSDVPGIPGTFIDTLEWNDIDISGQTGLSFSGLFGASPTFIFENTDFITVEVRIDGSGMDAYTEILSFQQNATTGTLNQDTNFDGAGDGTALNLGLSQFNAAIAGTGSTLDVRINFRPEDGGEEIAFDTFTIDGTAASAPPTLDTNNGSTLSEGGLNVVTTAELETNDTDTADTALVYTLDTATANGDLWVDADDSGTINGGEAAIGIGGTFTQQNIADGQLKYQHDGTETTSDSFQFDVSDGPNSVDNQTFDFTINAANDLPVVAGYDGDVSAYNEALGGPVAIEAGDDVVITDPDHPDFNGGSLTVSITGALPEDQLSINNGGAVGIGIVGNGVLFDSAQFATFAGGVNGADLVVTFAAGSTQAIVAELIEALRYDNSSVDNPTAGPRSINIVVNDGVNDSATSTATVNVTAVNDDPDAIDDMIGPVNEDATLVGVDLFAANPTTADSDVDGTFSITAVQGGMSPQATANGGIVTVTDSANGLVTYDPNGAFEYLGVGVTTTDTFTYTITDSGGAMDTATVTVTVTGIDNNDTFNGTGGGVVDTINAGVGMDTVFGLSGNDVLNGEAGNDTINGGNGSDTISGGDNDDMLYGANGDDILNGGSGDDFLKGNAHRDTLNGDGGADILQGGSANDVLNGGADNDRLYGGTENDRLNGGAGDDILRGEAGTDTFIFEIGNEIDRIRDFEDGTDQINLSSFGYTNAGQALANASQVGANVRFIIGTDTLVIENELLANISGDDLILM